MQNLRRTTSPCLKFDSNDCILHPRPRRVECRPENRLARCGSSSFDAAAVKACCRRAFRVRLLLVDLGFLTRIRWSELLSAQRRRQTKGKLAVKNGMLVNLTGVEHLLLYVVDNRASLDWYFLNFAGQLPPLPLLSLKICARRLVWRSVLCSFDFQLV